MQAKAATHSQGYRVESGHDLSLHPDGVRIATGVFEFYVGSVSTEEAMARAIVAYNTWLDRFLAEERRRGSVR